MLPQRLQGRAAGDPALRHHHWRGAAEIVVIIDDILQPVHRHCERRALPAAPVGHVYGWNEPDRVDSLQEVATTPASMARLTRSEVRSALTKTSRIARFAHSAACTDPWPSGTDWATIASAWGTGAGGVQGLDRTRRAGNA
jgi:hypothetical protein